MHLQCSVGLLNWHTILPVHNLCPKGQGASVLCKKDTQNHIQDTPDGLHGRAKPLIKVIPAVEYIWHQEVQERPQLP